jgi:hypothetical protein
MAKEKINIVLQGINKFDKTFKDVKRGLDTIDRKTKLIQRGLGLAAKTTAVYSSRYSSRCFYSKD